MSRLNEFYLKIIILLQILKNPSLLLFFFCYVNLLKHILCNVLWKNITEVPRTMKFTGAIVFTYVLAIAA